MEDEGSPNRAQQEWDDFLRREGFTALVGMTPEQVAHELTWHPHDEPPPRASDGDYLRGREWREWVKTQSPQVMVGLSFGKDSLATFHAMLDTWDREDIIGYWLYPHPHLGWQQRQLAYYRRELGIRIYAVAHRTLWTHLQRCLFQPPQNRPVIWKYDIHEVAYEAIYWAIANDAGIIDARPWVAHGVRAADSPMRRIVISRRGPYNLNQRTFYPIWEERKADIVPRIRDLGVKLPVDYRMFGRSFDGQDYRFIEPLAREFPEDYARLREMFPLMETEFIRRGEVPPDIPEPEVAR